ncbi:unnamed protein product [Brachionus calyciflorus]|uniref:EGF-like domain-containing protein n=1 Tax=Brachionus calyciflorus TaxID=104777 RepID=A0A814GH04_9BILA|nr:unnamed protein product [Brachionus calyciflorus]
MKKILVQLLALVFFSQILDSVYCQQCTSNQIWDFKLNKCIPNLDCFNQQNDDPKCLTLDCATNGDICPKKCYCQQPSILNDYSMQCFNGGVLNKSICLNGGYLDPRSCKCVCLPGYIGNDCSKLDCSSVSNDPVECNDLGDICDDPDLKLFCLKKCSCSGATNPSLLFKTCAPMSCQNGGNLDLNSCKCVCLPGFSGENCQSVNCSADLVDPFECLDLKPFCSDDADIKNYCIKTCNC